MSQLDQIKAKVEAKLMELNFFDAADLDDVNVITTSSTGSIQDTHNINVASGVISNGQFEGKDTQGRNIHLPVEYIVDIN
jgi:hypothetical protein